MTESVGHSGKGMQLHTKILLGLVVGATLGVLANTQLGGNHAAVAWTHRYVTGPVGQVFLRMLFMIVMPLVFASISLGVAGLGDLRRVGRAALLLRLVPLLRDPLLEVRLDLLGALVLGHGAEHLLERGARLVHVYDPDAMREELVDRFGIPPEPARALIECHRLRVLGQPLGIARMDATHETLQLQFQKDPPIDRGKMIAMVQQRKNMRLAGADRVYCYSAGLQWDATAVLAPLGAKAEAHADFDRLLAAVAGAARAGDHIVIMSNGGFNGIHEKLLARLAKSF